MRWYLPVLTACYAALVVSCGGIGLAHEEPLVDDIGLVACDTQDQMSITDFRPGSGGRLIPETVYAVGWDPSHIIVKRHPEKDARVDKTRTEYFIVVVRERRAYGPFDEPEFHKQRTILKVTNDLQFTRVFVDLE